MSGNYWSHTKAARMVNVFLHLKGLKLWESQPGTEHIESVLRLGRLRLFEEVLRLDKLRRLLEVLRLEALMPPGDVQHLDKLQALAEVQRPEHQKRVFLDEVQPKEGSCLSPGDPHPRKPSCQSAPDLHPKQVPCRSHGDDPPWRECLMVASTSVASVQSGVQPKQRHRKIKHLEQVKPDNVPLLSYIFLL